MEIIRQPYFENKDEFKTSRGNLQIYSSHIEELYSNSNHKIANQTRSQRIRAAMFPETLEDVGNENSNTLIQNNNGKPTAIQRLSTPSQMLKTAVLHLINYQDDAEVTQRSVPELIKLLNDEDQSTIKKVLAFIDQLSTKDASRHALASSQSLISALVNLIKNSNDVEIQNNAASAIKNICNSQQGLITLFKSGGILALIKLLSSPVETIVYYAITTLHNLLLYEDSSKSQILKYSGIQKMVQLLNHKNNKFLAILLDCLHILAFSNSEAKFIIAASGGPKELVRLMRLNNYEKLLWTAVRLMKVLSICPENKPALIQNGAMQVLTDHLLKPLNDRILINCLLTLRNLSDCAIKEDNLDVLIKKLIELLNANTDINISICSAGILSNLTCNNDLNKTKFVEYNGIETLVRTMVQSNNSCEEILEPVVCTLRHVTNRHSQAIKAQESIRLNYGLQVIVSVLQSESSKWPLLKACIGLIKNLALSENNLAPLRELGVIPKIVQLLMKSINLHQNAQKNNEHTVIDEIPMEEIIEGCVSALQQLSRDDHNRIVVRELKCIPLLVQLLFMTSENIQRVACGCLCELANDKEGTELIEKENATDKLTDLLRSKDEALATYAAAILFRLSEDKVHLNQKFQTDSYNINSGNNGADKIYSSVRNVPNGLDYNPYNAINPYELEMQQQHYSAVPQLFENQILVNAKQISTDNDDKNNNQHQQPTWFDTDL